MQPAALKCFAHVASTVNIASKNYLNKMCKLWQRFPFKYSSYTRLFNSYRKKTNNDKQSHSISQCAIKCSRCATFNLKKKLFTYSQFVITHSYSLACKAFEARILTKSIAFVWWGNHRVRVLEKRQLMIIMTLKYFIPPPSASIPTFLRF